MLTQEQLHEIDKNQSIGDIPRLLEHIRELERAILKVQSQNYCTLCGRMLDGYTPELNPPEHYTPASYHVRACLECQNHSEE